MLWVNHLVEFTQSVLAQDRVRLLGIRFGHQIVGRALGVKVGRSDQGWEVALCDVDLTAKGKELFGRDKLICMTASETSRSRRQADSLLTITV